MAGQPGNPTKFWHLRSGDALRAAACLGIVCFHLAPGALFVTGNLRGAGGTMIWTDLFTGPGEFFLQSSALGFYLFFVLSGFLVSAPYVSAFVEGRPRPRLPPYFRNRALRLLPAAWLMFAVVLIRHGTRDASPGELLSMFTFTEDHLDSPFATLVGQTWTLRVDLAFYVIVPIASLAAIHLFGTRLGVPGRRRLVWAAAAAGAAASLLVAGTIGDSLGGARSPASLFCLFMPGVAMAAALSGRARFEPRAWIPWVAAALSIAGLLVLAFRPRGFTMQIRLMTVGTGAALIIGGLILLETHMGRTWKFLTAKPVLWVGARSYGIYLWHFVLMSELYSLFNGVKDPQAVYLGMLPWLLIATLIAADLSFRFVERPAYRLRSASWPEWARWRGGGKRHAALEPGPARLAAGDPLRALAVLGIVAIHVATGALFVTGHLAGAGGTTGTYLILGESGQWLMEGLRVSGFLFFGLTGFLVARPFVEAFVLGRERPSLRAYARNRALRILPAAWVALAFLYLHHGTRGASAGEVVSSLTLTESYAPHPLQSLMGHLWMTKVGVLFYVLVPVVALVAGVALARRGNAEARRRVAIALAGAGLAASLVYAALSAGGAGAERSLLWALTGFVPGVALAAVLAGRRVAWRDVRRARRVAAAVFVAGWVVAVLAGRLEHDSAWLGNLVATVAAAAILGAPLCWRLGGGGTWRLLDNPILRWVGIAVVRPVPLALPRPLRALRPARRAGGLPRRVRAAAARDAARHRRRGGAVVAAGRAARAAAADVAAALARRVADRAGGRPGERARGMSATFDPPAVDGPGALLSPEPWQMTLGERAALEGLLARLRPALAVEIGTAEGGSARCLARHCEELHLFDRVHPAGLADELPNAVLHTGDSHVLLPAVLDRMAAAGRTVDFALVDGDHTAWGVQRDMEDLLESPAVRRTVIVAHDAANEEVRAGLEACGLDVRPEVAFFDLDFVPGHLSAREPYEGAIWGGLALVIVDPGAWGDRAQHLAREFVPAADLLRVARGAM